MAFPLLIDTNILLKLISTVDISPTLLQLDWMVNKHYVTLLVPEVLKEEWNKHRQGGIKKINAAVTEFKMNARRSRTVDDPLTGLREEQAEEFEEELLKQMDIIDTLVKTAGVFLPRTIDLTLLVREWKAKDKAPFKSSSHKDNWNDAELILSAAAYCTVSSQISLCFVSENKKEFADPVLNDLRLHPHISEHYPSLAFEYHLDIRDAFRSLQEQGIPHYKPEERENYNKIYNFIPVDRSLPILNQVYQYLTARFVDWRNIPKHLFTEHYPFILAEQFPSYHQPFTLITDNPEVFALLTEIKVDRDQVIQGKEKFITNEVDEEQLLYILQCLTRNLITEVAMGNNGPVHIQYTPVTVTCDCALCKFNRFQFTDLFQPMMEGGKPALAFDERWRNAYVQYKLCNYTRAAKEMQQLLQEIEGQRSVARYLLSFNLILLGKMIRNMIWNDEEAVRWGEELTRMDLDKILKACRTPENKTLLEYVHEKQFFKDTLVTMTAAVTDIKDKFFDQSRGSNDSTRKLLESYHVTESFLDQNGIVYDVFQEFDTLVEYYVDGLFASHGCNKGLAGRLLHFNDYRVGNIVLAAKPDDIRKYFRRYKLKYLEYVQLASNEDNSIERFERFFSQRKMLGQLKINDDEQSERPLIDLADTIFLNQMTLLAILNITPVAVNLVAAIIAATLKQEDRRINFRLHRAVKFFIARKQKWIEKDILHECLINGLWDARLQKDEEYFEILDDALQERHEEFSLPELTLTELLARYFSTTDQNDLPSWYVLGVVYKTLTNDKQKAKIRESVANHFTRRFDYAYYERACMFDMMKPTSNFTLAYQEIIHEILAKGSKPRPFDWTNFYTDPRLDHFINFCWHFNIPIPNETKDELTSLGGYYNWLMNIDEFDYSLFDPHWILHHFTYYYKLRYRNSKILKTELWKRIQDERDGNLEYAFSIIYAFENG